MRVLTTTACGYTSTTPAGPLAVGLLDIPPVRRNKRAVIVVLFGAVLHGAATRTENAQLSELQPSRAKPSHPPNCASLLLLDTSWECLSVHADTVMHGRGCTNVCFK